MAAGFPTKSNFATGDVLTATQMNDLAGTVNLLKPTAKGSVFAASAANTPYEVTVGADATVLTADAASTGGVKWATVAGGGMTLLSTTTLSGTSTTVSSISQSYVNLLVLVQNPYVSATDTLRINPNGSTSSFGSKVEGGTAATSAAVGQSSGTIQTTSTPTDSGFFLMLNNYTDTTYGKTFFFSGAGGALSVGAMVGGIWRSAAAVTSMVITTTGGATFSGGRVLIYGVK